MNRTNRWELDVNPHRRFETFVEFWELLAASELKNVTRTSASPSMGRHLPQRLASVHKGLASEIQGCDHFFDISTPLVNDKLLEHLHWLNFVCHLGVCSSVTIKMLVGLGIICIAFFHQDIAKILSSFRV